MTASAPASQSCCGAYMNQCVPNHIGDQKGICKYKWLKSRLSPMNDKSKASMKKERGTLER